MKKDDTIKIQLNTKELKDLIKKYYENTLCAKDCKVKMSASNILDRIKCVEVFRDNDTVFYSTVYKTIVTGKIETIRGNYNRFIEERDVEGTKEIIRNALASEYNYSTTDVNIEAQYTDNKNGGFDVNILGANASVDQKILRRSFRKYEK